MHTFYFIDAEQALKWSTEVMRKAQFPKISPVYKELLLTRSTEESRKTLTDWFGETANLPTDHQDRYALAQDVYKVVLQTLSEDDVTLIRLKYWGDYVTSYQLAKALKEQDILRRQGIYRAFFTPRNYCQTNNAQGDIWRY